ncbi:MAG: thymidylate synthase [Candidatus Paceibacterota bacterium]|jgi:thymidylate synthase
MTKFDQIYQNLISDIMKKGFVDINKRTGHKVKAIPGVHFSIDIEKEGFPLLTLRKIPLKVFVAEQVWFLTGARKPEIFLRDFTKIWDDFTNPGDVVTVAYGYRMRKHFGRDQMKLLVDLLLKDPSSRHGVVVFWDPASDGLGGVNKKNVPCPYTFTTNIIAGRLHLHLIVRSNDMLLGFPHDVAGFALLQCMLAQKLGVKPGVYSHSISNAHIYDTHYFAGKEIMKRKNNNKPIVLKLPKNSFNRAEKGDKKLVEEIFDNLNKQYKPMESIRGIKIIL